MVYVLKAAINPSFGKLYRYGKSSAVADNIKIQISENSEKCILQRTLKYNIRKNIYIILYKLILEFIIL